MKNNLKIIAESHQIFHDKTGLEISISIDRALRLVLEAQQKQLLEEFEKMIGEDINILGFTGDKPSDYVEGKVEGYNQAKQEIRSKLKALKDKV